MARKMPKQKPHRSEQAVGTPREFLGAVVERLGPIRLDLAANKRNRVCRRWIGPGSSIGQDFFAMPGRVLNHRGLWWLNPPYTNIGKWAKRCAELVRVLGAGYKIAFLVPASVGSNWFAKHVHGKALVLFVSPRLKFVGHAHAYPKDLMLVVYGERPGIRLWRWK
jgi:hypothetical protein